MLEKIAAFVKVNHCALLGLLIVTSSVGTFIAGIILLKKGYSLPTGELYNCNNQAFKFVAMASDAASFYKKLQGNCLFVSSCGSNLTSIVMRSLCEKSCETLFVSTNTTDAMLVRICSGNMSIGLGTMMAVWGGAGLFCFLLSAIYCCHAVVEPLVKMRDSFRQLFFTSVQPTYPVELERLSLSHQV